ncbi:uncharacterized protein NDAI_0C05650 [Naumovozyma dairenensis CBS 421]|uniref:MADS-box domain-containing protein n=1 Tax=Naumovozyma dairenensis (strain ATCC 10597 / BCRC 20456 / CBS 421 / NBRC 0211 / NRRL Y-12639) TaxID=1071378 RepID=G0W8W3_NAUDC|nr:hypothetical protein NDAI_0C05650 [Naumovozyma dairenensis CBS 421]CCD24224.1 hypothetical protein NDAI_0C05650 [Naumovozyma dairenensis CBS 421]
MGRRKIEIKPIEEEKNRSVTFAKRKAGLFKKAHELAVLCQVDVALIVLGANNAYHQYSSTPLDEFLDGYYRYQKSITEMKNSTSRESPSNIAYHAYTNNLNMPINSFQPRRYEGQDGFYGNPVIYHPVNIKRERNVSEMYDNQMMENTTNNMKFKRQRIEQTVYSPEIVAHNEAGYRIPVGPTLMAPTSMNLQHIISVASNPPTVLNLPNSESSKPMHAPVANTVETISRKSSAEFNNHNMTYVIDGRKHLEPITPISSDQWVHMNTPYQIPMQNHLLAPGMPSRSISPSQPLPPIKTMTSRKFQASLHSPIQQHHQLQTATLVSSFQNHISDPNISTSPRSTLSNSIPKNVCLPKGNQRTETLQKLETNASKQPSSSSTPTSSAGESSKQSVIAQLPPIKKLEIVKHRTDAILPSIHSFNATIAGNNG